MSIADNIIAVQQRIRLAAESVGRCADEVMLLPVTKTVAPELILQAFATGVSCIGENKVQEIVAKAEALCATPHQVHLIGHLQTNKVKDVVDRVSCVQSVDTIRVARKLQDCLEEKNLSIEVLVQVNTSGEESKFGVAPDKALSLIAEIIQMPCLTLRGLMTIGAHVDDEEVIRAGFRRLKCLAVQAADAFSHRADFSVLSMGMSDDLELAVEEGSTLIRVGRAIFGARVYAE